jgi:hypothetical protein
MYLFYIYSFGGVPIPINPEKSAQTGNDDESIDEAEGMQVVQSVTEHVISEDGDIRDCLESLVQRTPLLPVFTDDVQDLFLTVVGQTVKSWNVTDAGDPWEAPMGVFPHLNRRERTCVPQLLPQIEAAPFVSEVEEIVRGVEEVLGGATSLPASPVEEVPTASPPRDHIQSYKSPDRGELLVSHEFFRRAMEHSVVSTCHFSSFPLFLVFIISGPSHYWSCYAQF